MMLSNAFTTLPNLPYPPPLPSPQTMTTSPVNEVASIRPAALQATVPAGLGQPTAAQLGNGMGGYFQQAVGQPRSSLTLQLPVNLLNMKASNFIGEVLLQGSEATKRFTEACLAQGLDLNLDQQGESVLLNVSGPAGKEQQLAQTAMALLLNPTIDTATWDTQKRIKTENLVEAHNQPGSKLGESLLHAMYGANHPYSIMSNDAKNLEALQQATPADVLAELKRLTSQPEQLKFFMVSALPVEQQAAQLNQELGGLWPASKALSQSLPVAPTPPPIGVPPAPVGVQGPILTAEESLTRSQLVMGWRGPTPEQPDFEAFQMLIKLAGGMSGGFFEVLRSQKGLVYSTHQQVDVQPKATQYLVAAEVDFPKTGEALDGIQQVIQQMVSNPPSAESLERIKRKTVLGLRQAMQTSDGLASVGLARTSYNLPPLAIEEKLARIERITPEQIQAVAQKYLAQGNGAMVFGVAAPKAVLEQQFPAQPIVQPQLFSVPASASGTNAGGSNALLAASLREAAGLSELKPIRQEPSPGNDPSSGSLNWLCPDPGVQASAALAPQVPLYSVYNRYLKEGEAPVPEIGSAINSLA